ESLRSTLAELGVVPDRLDPAIRRLDARRAGSRPTRLWTAAGVLVAAGAISLGLGFPFGWPSPEAHRDLPAAPAAEVAHPVEAPAPAAPPTPRQASVRQLRELQQQSLLVAGMG